MNFNTEEQPQEISRSHPLLLVFLLDQSGSMSESLGGETNLRKADGLADAINKTLQNLVLASTKEMGKPPRDYFYISIIGYGYEKTNDAAGFILQEKIIPISQIADNPLRVEKRKVQRYAGGGELITEERSFPVWFDPVAIGGTPMCKAFRIAKEVVEEWIQNYIDCLPPIVFNFTDGESTDGNPEYIAEEIKQISTQYGNVLCFNLHLSSVQASPVEYPDREDILPDEFSRELFRMSSIMPNYMIKRANSPEFGLNLSSQARGFVFNGNIVSLINFLRLGTMYTLR